MPWRFWTRLPCLSPSSSVCERLPLTTSDELVFSSLPYRPAPFLRGWHVSHRGRLAKLASFIDDLIFCNLPERTQLTRSATRLFDVQNLMHLPSTLPLHDFDG